MLYHELIRSKDVACSSLAAEAGARGRHGAGAGASQGGKQARGGAGIPRLELGMLPQQSAGKAAPTPSQDGRASTPLSLRRDAWGEHDKVSCSSGGAGCDGLSGDPALRSKRRVFEMQLR